VALAARSGLERSVLAGQNERRPARPRVARPGAGRWFRELLQNILSVNLTLKTKTLSAVSNEQNDQVM
jgi:hypothetical protein